MNLFAESIQGKKFNSEQIDEIVEREGWEITVCNHEPEPHLETLQIAYKDEEDYFAEFVGDPIKDEFTFKIYEQ